MATIRALPVGIHPDGRLLNRTNVKVRCNTTALRNSSGHSRRTHRSMEGGSSEKDIHLACLDDCGQSRGHARGTKTLVVAHQSIREHAH